MGWIKDRNGMDLTETEAEVTRIQRRKQEEIRKPSSANNAKK